MKVKIILPPLKYLYDLEKYLYKHKLVSYCYQLSLIYQINPKSILEIGVRANFLKKYFSDT